MNTAHRSLTLPYQLSEEARSRCDTRAERFSHEIQPDPPDNLPDNYFSGANELFSPLFDGESVMLSLIKKAPDSVPLKFAESLKYFEERRESRPETGHNLSGTLTKRSRNAAWDLLRHTYCLSRQEHTAAMTEWFNTISADHDIKKPLEECLIKWLSALNVVYHYLTKPGSNPVAISSPPQLSMEDYTLSSDFVLVRASSPEESHPASTTSQTGSSMMIPDTAIGGGSMDTARSSNS